MITHRTRVAAGIGLTAALILTGVGVSVGRGGQRGSSGSVAPGVVSPGTDGSHEQVENQAAADAQAAPDDTRSTSKPKAKSRRRRSVVSQPLPGISATPVVDGGFGVGDGLMPAAPAAPSGDLPKVFGPARPAATAGRPAPDWKALPYEGTSIKGLPLPGRLNDRQNEFLQVLSADDFIPPTRAPYFDWIQARQDSLRVIGWRGSVRSFQAVGGGYRAVIEFLPMLASAQAGKGTFTPDRIVEVYDYADGRYQLVNTDAPQNRVKMIFYH